VLDKTFAPAFRSGTLRRVGVPAGGAPGGPNPPREGFSTMRHRSARRSAALLTLAIVAGIAFPPGGLAQGIHPVERQDWTLGLAYGVGRASVELNADVASTDWTQGGSPQFRVGRMIGDHLMIGVEDRQWLDEGGLGEYKVRANLQNVSFVVTAYPGRTTDWTSGFFVQVGGGYAHARLSGLEPYEGGSNEWGETYEVVYKHDAGGWGAVFGLGYELRLSRHFAAGIATSYNLLRFDDDEVFKEVETFPGGLNLNWYF
jgi:hypothetical protein